MKRLMVVAALATFAGCMTPPAAPPAASVSSPWYATPSEWALKRVDYDADGAAAAAAPRGADVRVAFVRRCRGAEDNNTTITEISTRDEAIDFHVDRALAVWSAMPRNVWHTGCEVLRLEYRRRDHGPVPSGPEGDPWGAHSDPDRFVLVTGNDIKAHCISCPASWPSVPLSAGRLVLSGCFDEDGDVHHITVLGATSSDATLVGIWLFGASTFRPILANSGQPLRVCGPLAFNIQIPLP